jgi:hypothetical protein
MDDWLKKLEGDGPDSDTDRAQRIRKLLKKKEQK